MGGGRLETMRGYKDWGEELKMVSSFHSNPLFKVLSKIALA